MVKFLAEKIFITGIGNYFTNKLNTKSKICIIGDIIGDINNDAVLPDIMSIIYNDVNLNELV